ncbi:MAG: hypothetical protein ACJAYN_000783 [Bermanella sp.]|jgi:hypothetical protein
MLKKSIKKGSQKDGADTCEPWSIEEWLGIFMIFIPIVTVAVSWIN